MMNAELGQRRWEALLSPKCWLKILEMVTGLLTFPLCLSFNQIAVVHMKDTSLYYNISLMFPFIYEKNVTVQSPPGLPLREFKFDSILAPSAIVFTAVTVIALVLAILIFVFYIAQHGSEMEQSYINLVFFVVLGMTFLLLLSTSLWLSSLIRLKQNVESEINFVLKICKQNGDCEEKLANFAVLFVSAAFAVILFLIWLTDCILIYRKMVYTIPQEITRSNLVPSNVELAPVQN